MIGENSPGHEQDSSPLLRTDKLQLSNGDTLKIIPNRRHYGGQFTWMLLKG